MPVGVLITSQSRHIYSRAGCPLPAVMLELPCLEPAQTTIDINRATSTNEDYFSRGLLAKRIVHQFNSEQLHADLFSDLLLHSSGRRRRESRMMPEAILR